MTEVAFSIDGRAVPWQRAGLNRGRPFTPKRTRDWQHLVADHARRAMGNTTPMQGAVSLSVQFYQKVPTSWPRVKRQKALDCAIWPTGRPDLSNLVKSIEDACNGIVFEDDAQIVSLQVVKVYSQAAGVLVRCRPVAEELHG